MLCTKNGGETMSENDRRRTWQPVAEVKAKPHKCSVCGKDNASYSIDGGWNWRCWVCVPENSYFKKGDVNESTMY